MTIRRLLGVLMTSLFLSVSLPLASGAGASNCSFVLGFRTLHDLIPDVVGNCLVDEHHNPTNGDAVQETTGVAGGSGTGLLVWRKADNWTAYTDGFHTWLNGPAGLQERLNTACFTWEAGCSQSIASSAPILPGFQSLAQTWWHHGFTLNVSANGMADATWRIYGWCSDTPPPCDQEVGNTIVSGGAGQLLFYNVDGLTAWANVTASTDGTTLSPGSIVALTLQPYGLAQLTRGTADPNPLILCGSTTVLPPDVQATNPCGS